MKAPHVEAIRYFIERDDSVNYSDDKSFCSKLVWRIYENNLEHSVNVNSNHHSISILTTLSR